MTPSPHKHLHPLVHCPGLPVLWLLAALTFGLASCNGNNRITPPEPLPDELPLMFLAQEDRPIYLLDNPYGTARSASAPHTRSIIQSNSDLERECTPTNKTYPLNDPSGVPGGGNAIGFWTDMITYPSGTPVVEEDYFGFQHTQLVYDNTAGINPFSPWNISSSEKFWTAGARYILRAFYPFSEKSWVVEESSNALNFILECNTHKSQEDLMVAYNEVYTVDPVTGNPSIAIDVDSGTHARVDSQVTTNDAGTLFGFSQEFQLNRPIPLFFEHTMAAFQFRVGFEFIEEDELLAVSLTNGQSVNGLSTVGVLSFGQGNSSPAYAPPGGGVSSVPGTRAIAPAEKQEEQREKSLFKWFHAQTAFANRPFYEWRLQGPNGIPFSRSETFDPDTRILTVVETMAVAYSPKDHQWVHTTTYNIDTHAIVEDDEEYNGTQDMPAQPKEEGGAPMNENNGWVFIIPQRCPTDCYATITTKKCGSFTVKLPSITGTREDGTADENGTYFAAGHRYVYQVNVQRLTGEVTVTLEPWNELFMIEEVTL